MTLSVASLWTWMVRWALRTSLTRRRTALQEQAGETYREVLAYSGPLDLSGLPVKSLEGLTLIPGITELNASGTDLTAITSDMLPKELSSLNLTDCIALVDVELKTWPDLTVTPLRL